MNEKIREGEYVRLKKDRDAKGVIDEIYTENGVEKAAIIWEISGCIGDESLEDLERIPAIG